MLPFTDDGAAMQAYLRWCDDSGRVSDPIGDQYYSYWTNKYLWHDIGIGLASGALSLAALTIALRISRRGEIIARTPIHRWTYLAVGLGSLAAFWASETYTLIIDLGRQSFPICADSIGIPLSGSIGLAVVTTPIMVVIGFVITQKFGRLPVTLWQWNTERPIFSWIVSVVALVVGAGFSVALISIAMTSASFAAPGGIAAIYLVASTRAALLASNAVYPPSPVAPSGAT